MIDALTFRLVVMAIALVALGGGAAAVILTLASEDAGPAWGLAGAALTGLIGLLVNPRTAADPATDTTAAALTGYREANADLERLAAASDAGRADLVQIGVLLLCVALAAVLLARAGLI